MMYACEFILKRKFGNVAHELVLTRDDVRTIWAYYEQYLADENIWNKLRNDFGISNYSLYEDIIDAISHRYNKCIEWGCDHEYALGEAFSEHQERLEELMKQREGKRE